MSRDHGVIDLEAHNHWFAAALISPNKVILIGEIQSGKIGVVRFDRLDEGWEAGINVNPEYRGKGLSAQLLQMAVDWFLVQYPNQTVVATIRPDNQASRKIFEACGFRLVDRREEHDHFVRLPNQGT